MRPFIICAFLMQVGAGAIYAQNQDSLATKQLEEIVVNAKLNTTDASGVYFIPSNKQKTTAQNGIDLLRRMAIPQIKIGLADDNVTTSSGNSVAIFINFVQASAEELDGLKTSDVRRVEYYHSPFDQRFMGERNVINIIVQPYIYGGYTKISLTEKFFIGLSSNASVYSKFSYKKMTYDIFVGSQNFNNHHTSNYIQSEYLVSDNESKPSWVNRSQIPERSRYSQNIIPISFRATYSKRDFQMKNSFAFTFKDTPHNTTSGSLEITPFTDHSQNFTTESSAKIKTLSYNGNFNFNFPKHFYLTLSPKASYGHINQEYNYLSSINGILNKAVENNYSASIMAMSRKIVADVHYFFLRAFGGNSKYKVKYRGNIISSDNMSELYGGVAFQYGYYTDRFSADFLLGVRSERNTTNDDVENELYPYANANFGWSPNQRHSLNLAISYSKEPMNANLKSPHIMRDNELMYYVGNPKLKYSPNLMVNLGYNWILNNWLQIYPFAQFFGIFDRYVPIYTPYLDSTAIMRKYENDGNHYRTQIGLSVTANLLNGNLQLQFMPSQFFYISTGYYDMRYNPFSFSCSAIYYMNKFYFSGFYEMRNRALWTNSGTIYKDRSQLQFSGGWSNTDLNIRIGISNPYRTSWIAATKEFISPVYKEFLTSHGTTAHFNLNLSVTYTFGYGKKVPRGNEVGEQSSTSSAILQ